MGDSIMKPLFQIRGFLPYTIIVFLNAFVDLGHKIVIQNTVFKAFDAQTQIVLTAVVNGLILLPFILLFSPAGYLSDKYPKPRVIRVSAAAAVVIAALITLSYYAGWFWVAFALTLVLAIQSAVYSPAKYGYIREMVGNHNLAQANAWVQAVTIVAILAGTFVFSGFFEWLLAGINFDGTTMILRSIAPLGWLLIGFTVIELWASCRLPVHKIIDKEKNFSFSSYLKGIYLRRNIQLITSKRVIWLSIIGLSMFWAVCQVVLAAFPAYAKATLAETNTLVIQGILACSGLGIMLGSVIAGRLSKNYIELGLIPVGAIGVALTLTLLPALETRTAMALAYIALGCLGGIFIVPLNSLIQYHAGESQLGTILAGNNWVQNLTMLTFLALTALFAMFGLSSNGLFIIVALVAFAGAGHTILELPHSLTRLAASLIIKRAYRIRVIGFDHLPKEGGVLLLGNHISWIDWAVVQIACPRPVRFVMLQSIYNLWYLKPIFNLFGAIPISAGHSKSALEAINARLKAGEVVCLFPEGGISKTGQLGKFHGGYQHAVKGLEGVIVPFYLRGLWGSRFSKSHSPKLRKSTAQGLKRAIIIAFGKPLPLATKPEQLKQKIFELSTEAWESYAENLDPLPLAWLRAAKSQLSRLAAKDALGGSLSNLKMIASTLAFAHQIGKLDRQLNIGVMLPASIAALIANMAVLLRGHITVDINYTASTEAVQAGLDKAKIETVITSRKFSRQLSQRGLKVDTLLAGRKLLYMEDTKACIPHWRLLLNLILAAILPASLIYRVWGQPCKLTDPAAILFSSGSENTPKGIVLSHKNIMANIKQISEVLNTREEDVVIGCLPPFHSFGLTVTSFMPLIEGLPVVCHPDPTDALNIAKAVAKNKATILCATASFLRLYTRNKKVNPLMLNSLRVVVAGAEKLTPAVREAFKLKFNKDIYEGYGATETTPVASVNIPDQLDTVAWKVQAGNKPGSVGLPVPGCSFRIVDPETMAELPLGKNGLILISGSQVMLGYLNDEKKTQEAIVEIEGRHWYKTGDKGHIDHDGFLTIVDRYSRFAKLGGEMVSLGAVEQMLKEHLNDPERELVAINLPDDKKGEKIVLLIAGEIEGQALRHQLVKSGCNPMLIPSEFIFMDTLPKLGSGKTDFKSAKALAQKLVAG